MMNLNTMVLGLSTHDVVESILPYWEHDEGSLKFWRASSNFVFVYKHQGTPYFLRFAHADERTYQQISAELDFLTYLQQHGFAVATPVRSKQGNLIETVNTSQGSFYAVTFTRAAGRPLDLEEMTEELFNGWGASLGTLHHLSQSYNPTGHVRKSWQDAWQDIQSVLAQHSQETAAVEEANRLAEWLHTLPQTEENFGLIHYDFEPDNVFHDAEEKTAPFCVIDFDDAMYHWYVMDIANALQDVHELGSEKAERFYQAFLNGYRSKKSLDQSLLDQLPTFARFANLYKFARVLRSLQGIDTLDLPQWAEQLRVKLVRICDQKRAGFQHPW